MHTRFLAPEPTPAFANPRPPKFWGDPELTDEEIEASEADLSSLEAAHAFDEEPQWVLDLLAQAIAREVAR